MISRVPLLLALLSVGLPSVPRAAGTPPSKPAAKARSDARPVVRELRRRTLRLDDASVTTLPELHVAGGATTVLTFQTSIADGGVTPGAVKDLFYPFVQTDRMVIIAPKADLKAPVPVNVALKDGTVITFQCLSVPEDADAQVDVIVELKARASQDSAASLKITIGQLRGQLDDCKATTGEAGTQKLASLFLTQSLESPQAFARYQLRGVEKQNRLLLEARWSYRLLGLTYIVLVLENRDPERPWVLDRAEVKMVGSAENADVQVRTVATEYPTLAPDVSERIVVVFPTPTSSGRQKVTVTLHEKDGGRQVALSSLEI